MVEEQAGGVVFAMEEVFMQRQEAVRSKRLVRRTAGCKMHCSGPALVLCSSLINVLPVSVKAGRKSVLARLITCSRVFFMFSPSYSLHSHFEGGDKPHPLGTHCSRLDFLCTKRRELENMRNPRQISYMPSRLSFLSYVSMLFWSFLHSRDEHRDVLFRLCSWENASTYVNMRIGGAWIAINHRCICCLTCTDAKSSSFKLSRVG